MHSSAATGINNASRIVGYYDMKHGFLDNGVSFKTIDVPGSQTTFPFGINGARRIVGFFGDIGLGQLCGPKKPTHGFLDSGGSFTTIDVPGATQTCAYGINDLGQIVGLFSDTTGTHGFPASPNDGTGERGSLVAGAWANSTEDCREKGGQADIAVDPHLH